MPDQPMNDAPAPLTSAAQTRNQESRSQARSDSVLAQIEDATYAVLRKHEKKPV